VLATRILNLEHVGGTALDALARLLERTPSYEVRSTGPRETLNALVQALEAA
jgi:hypothetical protein